MIQNVRGAGRSSQAGLNGDDPTAVPEFDVVPLGADAGGRVRGHRHRAVRVHLLLDWRDRRLPQPVAATIEMIVSRIQRWPLCP